MHRLSRLVISTLGLVLGAALLAVVPASPAQAIDCHFVSTKAHGEVMTKNKLCEKFNVRHRGAKVTETWSDYLYYTKWPQQDPNILHILRLTDTQADGKCVSIRASKEGGPAPFDVEQVRLCGKGKTKKFQLNWEGQNMAEGTLLLWACEGRSCKAFWAQALPAA